MLLEYYFLAQNRPMQMVMLNVMLSQSQINNDIPKNITFKNIRLFRHVFKTKHIRIYYGNLLNNCFLKACLKVNKFCNVPTMPQFIN